MHGRADTGVREMAENMKREEEDLCGKRGLIPNTEQQTFQMALPRKLRSQYDKVMLPITMPQVRLHHASGMTFTGLTSCIMCNLTMPQVGHHHATSRTSPCHQ